MNSIAEESKEEDEIVDLLIFTEYEGFLPEVSIGEKYQLDFLNKYSLIW